MIVVASKKRPPKQSYLAVVQQKYKRSPTKKEVIHHLDENPWHNHYANLVLLPKWAHWVMHTWDRAGWFRDYGTEILETVKAFMHLHQFPCAECEEVKKNAKED